MREKRLAKIVSNVDSGDVVGGARAERRAGKETCEIVSNVGRSDAVGSARAEALNGHNRRAVEILSLL